MRSFINPNVSSLDHCFDQLHQKWGLYVEREFRVQLATIVVTAGTILAAYCLIPSFRTLIHARPIKSGASICAALAILGYTTHPPYDTKLAACLRDHTLSLHLFSGYNYNRIQAIKKFSNQFRNQGLCRYTTIEAQFKYLRCRSDAVTLGSGKKHIDFAVYLHQLPSSATLSKLNSIDLRSLFSRIPQKPSSHPYIHLFFAPGLTSQAEGVVAANRIQQVLREGKVCVLACNIEELQLAQIAKLIKLACQEPI